MIIPLSIAEKLLLLAAGEQLPASRLRHALVIEMLAEGIISQRIEGRTKGVLYISDSAVFARYISNRYGIPDLAAYVATIKDEHSSRAQLVQVAGNSKAAARRTFSGFLLNSYMPVSCQLDGKPLVLAPSPGTLQFIYNYGHFVPPADALIVGTENPENFRDAAKLAYLFGGTTTLFISRYPQEQGRDVIRWLQSIPNPYCHLGDYDFAGINIYLREYKKHLGDRATFFIPPGIETLLERHGNPSLYDAQQLHTTHMPEPGLQYLLSLLHQYKRGLEQEILLVGR